jgi:uncharacterized protein
MSRGPGPGYLPEQAQIDVYGNGGFRFADMSHRGSILCLPSGIHAWPVTETSVLGPADFDKVLEEADKIEFLILGTGMDIRPVPKELRARLKASGIAVDPMSTGAAVRTYNIMVSEKRPVAAALIAV